MKKKIILSIVIIVLIIIAILIICNALNKDRFKLSDYGVSIKLSSDFKRYKGNNASHLLYAKNDKTGITVSATELRGDFWSSGDIMAICDEYINLLSVGNYEYTYSDVKIEKKEIDNETLGIVHLKREKNEEEQYLYAVLTPKSHGYLSIEIYKDSEKDFENEAMNIINSITISKNTHNYNLDVSNYDYEKDAKEYYDFIESLGISGDYYDEEINI